MSQVLGKLFDGCKSEKVQKGISQPIIRIASIHKMRSLKIDLYFHKSLHCLNPSLKTHNYVYA